MSLFLCPSPENFDGTIYLLLFAKSDNKTKQYYVCISPTVADWALLDIHL